MALSNETQSWLEGLAKEGNLSPEVVAQLRTAAESNPKADEYFKGSVLRQSDFSRRQAELDKAKLDVENAARDLQTKEAAVTVFQGELAGWKSKAEPEYKKALLDKANAESKLAGVISRARAVAQASGLSEQDLGLEDVQVPIDDKKVTPQFDTSEFVTRADIRKTVAESALIDASIHDLDMTYFELTGKHVKNAAELVQGAIAAGRSISDFASEKLGLPALQKQATEAAVQKRIDEGVAAGLAEKLSDPALAGLLAGTGGRTDLPQSPIFGRGAALPSPGSLDAGEGGKGVPAAIAAFQSGKYKGR